ncbi:MAG TPA: flagellar basal-body MS-ring/collar protein FliF [Conexibacter sp.]|jgi:flagellar M-ring protein FliF
MPTRALLANLSTRGKLALGGGALAILIVIVVLMKIATAPSFTTLLTGMDPKDTGDVTAALDQRGIAYQLQNNGTALAVQKGQTAEARVALATAGVPSSSSQQGYTILDNEKLGTSNFQQQIDYQRALEGEISKTIEDVDGVSDASVQLVLPDRDAQLFADSANPATAAVLLSGSTGALTSDQVRGIAQLVTNSVPGLKSDKVTITDATGSMLWPTSTTDGGTGGDLLAKQAAEARYDQQLASSLTSMLATTLGPGKAQVKVNADLDANQATQDRLVYGRAGVPVNRRTDNESLIGRGAGTGGPAGTAGNTPPVYAQLGTGNSRYRHRTEDQTMAIDKTVTRTRIAPGSIQRQQVAVLVDRSIPAAMLPQIRAAVISAAGIDARRGDSVSLGQVAFAPAPRVPTQSVTDKFGDYLKYGLLGLAALIFLIVVGRQLRKREQESLAGEPTWLREIEAPRSLAELEYDEAPTRVLPLRSPDNPDRLQVEELVDRDPARVAQHVRAWMQED